MVDAVAVGPVASATPPTLSTSSAAIAAGPKIDLGLTIMLLRLRVAPDARKVPLHRWWWSMSSPCSAYPSDTDVPTADPGAAVIHSVAPGRDPRRPSVGVAVSPTRRNPGPALGASSVCPAPARTVSCER
ncbi:hypothetical protein GCM10009541_43270 [Micromonospora gifhornensis]|uniref:Uncharacterized protein n=1 Tax=Micromonospora gifhornensis TaxID=84594 RepID=A0ABQ4IE36_9ACTN|nr:hypothetical protein Vgi01_28580 [Micromonospora gifhornensis]